MVSISRKRRNSFFLKGQLTTTAPLLSNYKDPSSPPVQSVSPLSSFLIIIPFILFRKPNHSFVSPLILFVGIRSNLLRSLLPVWLANSPHLSFSRFQTSNALSAVKMQLKTSLALAFVTAPVVFGTVVPRGMFSPSNPACPQCCSHVLFRMFSPDSPLNSY